MGRVLARNWMVLVAAVVIGLAGFAVYRLHGYFGSGYTPKTPGGGADEIVPFNPKRVVLEVFGEPGATATISYLDVNSQPQRVDNAPLPWTYDETTTTPAVVVNISAQGDGSTLGCRITVDGLVKTERIANDPSAYTFCLDKSG
ncbi:MAG: MmpS family transport accessory protein [Mycobacteriaceae bacterium]